MSAHLTVSYGTQATAATPPGAQSVAGTAQAAANNPLGFLAALIDQITSGTTAAGGNSTDATTGANTATPPVQSLLDVNLDTTTQGTTAPKGASLLATLNKELDSLKAQLENGDKPDADLLKRLSDTINAIAALMATPNPQATIPTTDPATSTDPLATIGATSANASAAAALLASVGSTAPTSTPSTGVSAPATPAPTSTEPLPGIAALTDKLTEITKALAPVDPSTAQQLTSLAQKLDAAQTNPHALGGLATSSDPKGVALDASLQQSVNPPAATPAPQQFATQPLAVPDTLVTPKTKDAKDPAPATQSTTPATTSTTSDDAQTSQQPIQLKVTAAANAGATPATDDKPKTDAKLVAAVAAAVSNESKNADPVDPAASQVAAAVNANTAAQTAVPRALPAAYQTVQNPINMSQVAFEMVRQMHQGASRFTIRIDPPELGRIDVKMHVDSSGTVNARLTVERSETLDMFQRDRGSLEKALSQAGLDSSKTNLEFSLKQQSQGQNAFAQMGGGDQRQSFANSGARYALSNGDDDSSAAVSAITLYRGTASTGGVNLFV